MCSNPVLRIQNLNKTFKLFRRTRDRLAELVGLGNKHRNFTALSQINFHLNKGETLGIIGENGSGKSTLLKLIAGILLPDTGEIDRHGRIAGLLELGTGFNQQLSGRKNIYLNGVYLDLKRKDLVAKEKAIIEFAELEEFIDEPLKTYSSGMMMRLGFAIAIHADPSCFIIDEALSVGDIRFQQKCYERLNQFRDSGGSILFVSHDLNAIRRLSNRVLLLDHGKIHYLGEPELAVNKYNELIAAQGLNNVGTNNGYGNGDIIFRAIRLLDRADKPITRLVSGEPLKIEFKWQCNKAAEQVTFGFLIRDRYGQDIFGTNGSLLKTVKDIDRNGTGLFTIDGLNIGSGLYTISMAAHTGNTHLQNCFHWWDNAVEFEILDDPDYRFSGIARLNAKLELK